MDAATLTRVKFYAGTDGWEAWQALGQPASSLDVALAEYGDARLVAAWVLDQVCADARKQAVQAEVAAGPQVKAFKVVGQYEEEYFAPVTSTTATQADAWCRKAAELRAEVERATRTTRRSRSVVYRPEGDA